MKGEDQEQIQGQEEAEAVKGEDKKDAETKAENAIERSVDEKMDEDKDTEDKKTGTGEKATKEGGEDKENQT